MAPGSTKKLTAPRAALLAAIERGLLRPHGDHFAIRRRNRVRIFQRRFVERAIAAHGYILRDGKIVRASA
jgi:hypothetical protein